jgi:hypothetical protein
VDALPGEQPVVLVPREEDHDRELEPLPGRWDIEPGTLVRRGDDGLLAHALRPDHDLRQREVDVGESGEQLGVEIGRTGMSLPAAPPLRNLVDAILGEGRDQPGQVTILLGDRVTLPELADLAVGGGVEVPP